MHQVACDHFYTYAEIQELLFSARDAYPELCKLENLGTTNGGRVI